MGILYMKLVCFPQFVDIYSVSLISRLLLPPNIVFFANFDGIITKVVSWKSL